ncbi:hypothetical protein Q7C36_002116 [Tachysurus vachellii]|uniref:CCHC-type domain-containing protein n=1 Tax=Tachysurus vachellii TaxID=175792 RepID=A0AA88TAE7_TACVA|nr:hypothetical protein Q7C36_002116 [Tachysurus vachellii]
MAGRGEDNSVVYTPLIGRGRGLGSPRENTGAIPKLLFPGTLPLPEISPRPESVHPACSTPTGDSPVATQQLQELIGRLSSQIGESIASHLLASQNITNLSPVSPQRSQRLISLRSDIKEPPLFKGDESDKYTVQEWIDVMELYLQKSRCPEAEKADTVMSHLLGRAKSIIKVGLRSTASSGNTNVEKIYDMLRRYFSDHPVSLLPLADFYTTQPKPKESPVDYWVRLNSAAERANSHLGRSGGSMENMSVEVAMMFIRNCPDPELSSVFKCKPMSKWSVEEIQEAIDEHQKESQSRRLSSSVRPRTLQVSTATTVSNVAVTESEASDINVAACVPVNHSKTSALTPTNSDALEHVLSMQHPTPGYFHTHGARNLTCRVCGDATHSTRSHCMREKRCLICMKIGHQRRECPNVVNSPSQPNVASHSQGN